MADDSAVEFKNVYEKYDLEIKTEGKTFYESFEALKDVSFSVKKGESLAVIGPNGAGKSTLLRLLAGLLRPEKGEVKVHGRVSSLLDLGAGFHAELTGRDNLLLNASLFNFSREEINAKLGQILEFADIGKFVDAPVRCYSQGMYVRLAFSLAIHVDPDILLIDDCLAVGDDNFRIKSFDKVLEFKAREKSIIFVTHDFGAAKQLCKRGLYLREGRVIKDGDIDEVVAAYAQPLSVDKKRYKYLSGKLSEEEEEKRKAEEQRRKGDEVKLRKELAERLQAEEEEWHDKEEMRRQKTVAEWTKQEDKRRRKEMEEWARKEESRQKEMEEWARKEEERQKAVTDEWNKKEEERRQKAAGEWARKEEERQKAVSEGWDKKEEERRQKMTEAWNEEKHQTATSEEWDKREERRRRLDVEAWNWEEEERQKAVMGEWDREEEARRRRLSEEWSKKEEDRQKAASEEWNQKEEERRQKAAEAWTKQEEERQKAVSEEWNKQEGERRKKAVEEWDQQEEERQKKAEEWAKNEEARQKAISEEWDRREERRRRLDAETWGWEEEERQKAACEEWDRKERERCRRIAAEWSKQEEERQKAASKEWDRQEEARRQRSTEIWAKQEEERRRAVSEEWNRREKRRRGLHGGTGNEKEKYFQPEAIPRAQSVTLLENGTFKLDVAPYTIRLFHGGNEITRSDGVRTIFLKDGTDISSSTATWRIRKLSDSRAVCFLKWPKPLDVFQVWYFTLLPEGKIDLEILSRTKDLSSTENERVECCFKDGGSIVEEERWGNKAKAFYFRNSGVTFETAEDNKVCGISPMGPYFLTIREYSEKTAPQKGKRRIYFKGGLSFGGKPSSSDQKVPLTQELECGRTKILFREGSVQLFWKQEKLTTGLGLYTSLFSKGVWYDSTQAKWQVKEQAANKFTVIGFWPWISISQTWEIVLRDEATIFLKCNMKILKETIIHLQETVLMLNEAYKSWRAGKEGQDFSEGFTTDDLFRVCPWVAPADGKQSISAVSKKLPDLAFQTMPMAGHRLLVENSAHIYNTRCRLFHCLRVNKEREAVFAAGDYDFFEGLITVNKEERV